MSDIRSLEAGASLADPFMQAMQLRQERMLKQQEIERQKAQMAMDYTLKTLTPEEMGDDNRISQKYMQNKARIDAMTGVQNVPQRTISPQNIQNPLENRVIAQQAKERQAQAVGQAGNNVQSTIKLDDGSTLKGTANDMAALASSNHPAGMIIRQQLAKNQSSLPATSTQLAQPLTNPQSSKFQRFAQPTQEQPQEAQEIAPQAQPTPLSPPTAAPTPPTQGGGQGEAIPEPDLSALEKPDVTLPQGTTMSMPKEQTFTDFSQIPSNMFEEKQSDNQISAKVSSNLSQALPKNLQPLAPIFEKYGQQYGVNPALLAAISMHETGNGTSRAFLQGQNAMGVSDSNGALSFEGRGGVEASIAQMAKQLGQGQAYAPFRKTGDIGTLASIYAPIGAENDPRGLNGDWENGVSKNFAMLQNPKIVQLGLGGAPDFALGQNMAKAQQQLNASQQNSQNASLSNEDIQNTIAQKYPDLTFSQQSRLQQSLQKGLPFVPKSLLTGMGTDSINESWKQNDAEFRKESEETTVSLRKVDSLLNDLNKFESANQFQKTSPLVGELYNRLHNIGSSQYWQEMEAEYSRLRQSLGSAGFNIRNMPEFNALGEGLPSTSKDPQVNKYIIDFMRAQALRARDEATFRNDYYETNHSTKGAAVYWAKFTQDNPMFVYKDNKPILNPNFRNYKEYFTYDTLGRNFSDENTAHNSGVKGIVIIGGRKARID